MNDAPHFFAKDRPAWRKWLTDNHDKQQAVWLVYDKGKDRLLTWQDIVQEALCFGWIDGRAGKVSDTQSKLYVSKRRPKSVWSKINKEHVKNLQEAGLITPAGQMAIDVAKKNGSWDSLNESDSLTIPPAMADLFTRYPAAKQNFDNFSVSSKRIILEWIYSAKRDETRMIRIQQAVEQAENNIKAR